MAVFGTFWDRTLSTRAGDAVVSLALTTLAHSLPATSPEIAIPVMRSQQAITGSSIPAVTMLALRGNASLNTVGFMVSSSASNPIIEFELVSAVLHTIFR